MQQVPELLTHPEHFLLCQNLQITVYAYNKADPEALPLEGIISDYFPLLDTVTLSGVRLDPREYLFSTVEY